MSATLAPAAAAKEGLLGRTLLVMIPFALLLHSAEEGMTFGRALPRIADEVARVAGRAVAVPTEAQVGLLLIAITLLGFSLYGLARRSSMAEYALVVLQATMALNVLSHSAGAIGRASYVPGLLTALFVEAPLSVAVFRQLRARGSLARWQWRALFPLAILLHGPVLIGLVLAVRYI